MFSNTTIRNLYAITYDSDGNEQKFALTKESFVEFCRHSPDDSFQYCDQIQPVDRALNKEISALNLQLPPLGLVKNKCGVSVVALNELRRQAIVPCFYEQTSLIKLGYHLPSYYSEHDVDQALGVRIMQDNKHHRSIASLVNDGFPNVHAVAKTFPSGKMLNILVADAVAAGEELYWHYGLCREVKLNNSYIISPKNKEKITAFLREQENLYKTITLAIGNAAFITDFFQEERVLLREALDSTKTMVTESAWRTCFDEIKICYILETPAALVYAVMQQLLSLDHLNFITNKLDEFQKRCDAKEKIFHHFSLIAPRLMQLEEWLCKQGDKVEATSYRETISTWATNGELERCLLLFAEESNDLKYSEHRVLPTAQFLNTQLYFEDWMSALQSVKSLSADAVSKSNQCRFYCFELFIYEKTMAEFRNSGEIHVADFVTYTKLNDIFQEIFLEENQQLLLFCPELKRICRTILPEVATSSAQAAMNFPNNAPDTLTHTFWLTSLQLNNLAERSEIKKLLQPQETCVVAAGHFSPAVSSIGGGDKKSKEPVIKLK